MYIWIIGWEHMKIQVVNMIQHSDSNWSLLSQQVFFFLKVLQYINQHQITKIAFSLVSLERNCWMTQQIIHNILTTFYSKLYTIYSLRFTSAIHSSDNDYGNNFEALIKNNPNDKWRGKKKYTNKTKAKTQAPKCWYLRSHSIP